MDSEYLKKHVGDALKFGLCEIAQKKPKDPIDYLSNWLLKYVENVEFQKQVLKDREQLSKERAVAEEERSRLAAMEEEQNRIAAELKAMESTQSGKNKSEENTSGVIVIETQAEADQEEAEPAAETKTDSPVGEGTSGEIQPDSTVTNKTEVISDTIIEEPEQNEADEDVDEEVTDSLEAS